MNNLLEFLLLHLVSHPEDIEIVESEEDGQLTFTIHVNDEDVGRVIGRKGRIIRAIRKISQIRLVKDNLHARIEVAD